MEGVEYPTVEDVHPKLSFSELVYTLFRGRPDLYAVRVETKHRAVYVPSTDPDSKGVARAVSNIGASNYGIEAIEAHISGEEFIGIYPIHSDSKVYFFALDFDRKNENSPDPWDAAVRQAEILWDEAELPVYIERSQSGNGYHVWGFLEEAVDAGKLRHALRPYLELESTYDMMFPNQDGLQGLTLGNLIALPLQGERVENGNSVFVHRDEDGSPIPYEDQEEFLRGIRLIPSTQIDRLFKSAPENYTTSNSSLVPREPERTEALSDWYKVTHPVFGCEFIRWCYTHATEVTEPLWYALACQFAQLEGGRDLFHEWSAQDPARYDANDTDRKFNHALKENKPHSCAAIRSLGGDCTCDRRFPGEVFHPYGLAKLTIADLIATVVYNDDPTVYTLAEGLADVAEWLAEVQSDPTIGQGIRTSIDAVSQHFGYREGEITVLGGRNSSGKTLYAIQEAYFLAEQRLAAVQVYSLEMTRRQVYTRLMSHLTGIPQDTLKKGKLDRDAWKLIREAEKKAKTVDLEVDDRTSHLDAILERAAEFVIRRQAAGQRAVIFIDYVNIIARNHGETEQDMIVRAMNSLKKFAKVMDCHVVLVAQLNRGADDATTESVVYDSWFRGSDAIPFIADNLIVLLGAKGPGVVERILVIHKQRNGEAGIYIPLECNQPIMTVAEMGTWMHSAPSPREPRTDAPKVGGRRKKEAADFLAGL